MLPNPPDKNIHKLQQMCYDFVWDGKRDKIKRTTAVKSIEEGGISIPSIREYIQSLKLSWFRKLLDVTNDQKWKHILLMRCPELNQIRKYGGKHLSKCLVNPFWKDVFTAYSDLHYKIDLNTSQEMLNEPFFCNAKFKINNKDFHFAKWTDKGIFYIKDLIKDNGCFLGHDEFQNKYGIDTMFLKYYGCISAIRKYLRKENILLETNVSETTSKVCTIFEQAVRGARSFYKILINKTSTNTPNACKSWERLLNTEIQWSKLYQKTKHIHEIKYRWFQIKITNRILVTNTILKSMGITTDDLCNFCHLERDTIYHYLWQCETTQNFWKDLETFMKRNVASCERLCISPLLVLFGYDNTCITDKGFDYIMILAKFYIYKCRINKYHPNLNLFIIEQKHMYHIDRYACKLKINEDRFDKKWKPYIDLVK